MIFCPAATIIEKITLIINVSRKLGLVIAANTAAGIGALSPHHPHYRERHYEKNHNCKDDPIKQP